MHKCRSWRRKRKLREGEWRGNFRAGRGSFRGGVGKLGRKSRMLRNNLAFGLKNRNRVMKIDCLLSINNLIDCNTSINRFINRNNNRRLNLSIRIRKF